MPLVLITGPVGSGKTSALLDAYAAGPPLRVLVQHASVGWRVVTHDGLGDTVPHLVCARGAELESALEQYAQRQVRVWLQGTDADGDLLRHLSVYIDEVQFCVPAGNDAGDNVDGFRRLARRARSVTAAGLDADAHNRPFGAMALLAAAADEVRTLRGVCYACAAPDAAHSMLVAAERVGDFNGQVLCVEPGDNGTFRAACAACWRPPPLVLLPSTTKSEIQCE